MNRLHYILVPGLHGGSSHLRSLATQLASARKTSTLYDLPSENLGNLAAYEMFLAGLISTKKPSILIAESFSSLAALSLAAKNPKNLKGLVLLGGFASFPLPSFVRPFANIMPPFPLWTWPFSAVGKKYLFGNYATRERVEALMNEMKNSGASTLARRIRIVGRTDLRADLPKIKIPILAIRGKQDRLISAKSLDELRAAPKCKCTEIDGAHIVALADPKSLAEDIVGFFGRA